MRQIIIFAKAPRLGTVKTRLARDIGATAALAFYRRSLGATITKARAVAGAGIVIHTSPRNALQGRYFPADLPLIDQGRGDIGARMARALWQHHRCDRILIGGDIPDIRTSDLAQALDHLRTHKAVFGPAEDGGFWLVGLRAGFQPRGLFQGAVWSSADTLQTSLATLPGGTPIAFVRTLNDIDNIEDYRRHKRREGR